MRREPEVPGEEAPVVECLDGPCKDYLKRNLHQLNHSVKVAPSRMLVLQDLEWLQICEKCS